MLISLLLVATLACVGDANDQFKSDQVTLPDIQAIILKTQDQIQTLQINTWSDSYDPELFPAGFCSQANLVAKAPYFLFHDSSHGSDQAKPVDDPFRQVAYISKDQYFNVYPINRTFIQYDLKPESILPATLKRDLFFMATGIWPVSGRTANRPFNAPYMLRDIANSIGTEEWKSIRLLDQTEDFGGRVCHIVQVSEHDRVWLDVERGCCVMKREIKNPDNGALGTRYVLEDHREIASGIWIPGLIRNMQFDASADTEIARQRKVIDSEVKIVKAVVNEDVDESAFVFQPSPGSYRLATPDYNESKQLIPGGLDHLHELAEWIQRFKSIDTSPESDAPMIEPAGRWRPYWIIVATIAFLGAFEIGKRWKLSH